VRVVVVSAFDGTPVRAGAEIFPGIIAIPVARPKRVFLDALVTLKRGVTRKTYAGPGGRLSAQGQLTRGANKIRELYFRIVYMLDDNKRWAWQASRAAVHACRKYDAKLILASGPPPSTLYAGGRAARKAGIPYVADLRDPLSDFRSSGHRNQRVERRLLRVLESWVMHRVAAVTSTTSGVAALLEGRYENLRSKVHVIRNGYDGGVAPALPATGGRLSILFAGELYGGRDPFPLLAGIEWLLTRPEVDAARIEVVFMGRADVYSGQSLESWMHGKRCASVVRIQPPQNAQGVAAAVMRSTVLLNLAQQQPLSVPAKTYEQLASGREVLLICEDDCETARLVRGIKGVTQVDPADFRALTDALLDLYLRHVVKGEMTVPAEADVSKFSRAVANEAFYAVLASVAPLGRLR
jgi:Glycosyl transferase 4-like domain